MTLQSDILFWILGFPLMGAILNGLLALLWRERAPRTLVSVVGVASLGFAFVLSVEAFIALRHLAGGGDGGNAALVQHVFTWFSAGRLEVGLDLLFDRLSAVMTLVVTGVGGLIHVFSLGYMERDPGYARYFAYLNLFTFAMLTLILGASLPVMFLGWEGVGLCSYLLIGFWYADRAKARAGLKAFVVNRVGDSGFLLGMFLLWSTFGTMTFAGLKDAVASAGVAVPVATVTLACLLLMVGATGKSAQIPLYVWLPDAMAGPTPVSALIHAATMVTAGVFMVVRLNFLFVRSPVALAVVAGIGAATALFAATIAITQNDIKKVLAYSTVSQLGFMFLAAGVGAFAAAIFHLVTHAFFKACLFLGAGSVIHAMEHAGEKAHVHGDPNDIRRMGGLARRMPWTGATFGVSVLAIAGFPFLSGFFSKDEILWHAFATVHRGAAEAGTAFVPVAAFGVGLVAALLTAFYMGRLFVLTFLGSPRTEEAVARHVHEAPMTMVGPMLVLAVLAVVGGLLGLPHGMGHALHLPHLLGDWLQPVLSFALPSFGLREGVTEGMEPPLMALSAGIGLVGLAAAWAVFRKGPEGLPSRVAVAPAVAPVHRLLSARYHVDEVYDLLVVRPLSWVADVVLHRLLDRFLVDTVLIGLPVRVVDLSGRLLRLAQNGDVQRYAAVFAIGLAVLVAWVVGR